ncbi:hypothetical protein C4588_03655 [Candidatus Parcubacteria bacterium]|nr:MAG: hypothetical protein C4588_03655 [Candidatus Parcubacteria bacterium]
MLTKKLSDTQLKILKKFTTTVWKRIGELSKEFPNWYQRNSPRLCSGYEDPIWNPCQKSLLYYVMWCGRHKIKYDDFSNFKMYYGIDAMFGKHFPTPPSGATLATIENVLGPGLNATRGPKSRKQDIIDYWSITVRLLQRLDPTEISGNNPDKEYWYPACQSRLNFYIKYAKPPGSNDPHSMLFHEVSIKFVERRSRFSYGRLFHTYSASLMGTVHDWLYDICSALTDKYCSKFSKDIKLELCPYVYRSRKTIAAANDPSRIKYRQKEKRRRFRQRRAKMREASK